MGCGRGGEAAREWVFEPAEVEEGAARDGAYERNDHDDNEPC